MNALYTFRKSHGGFEEISICRLEARPKELWLVKRTLDKLED